MMKAAIINGVRQIDYALNSACLKAFPERRSLIIFLFHIIFRSEDEASSNAVWPLQGITLERFRQFMEYFQNHNYTFVSPDDILNGLDNKRNYCMITFDDGYYNNRHVLGLLEEYKAPALFLISTDYVKNNRSFWWDVLHRERSKTGMAAEATGKEINSLTPARNEDIEKRLRDEFGEAAFVPLGDIDRPFTPQELKEFAREKYVFLGNHTGRHSYLTKYSPDEIRSAILSAQNDMHEITGEFPSCISYPHGAYSGEVIRIAEQAGLKLGITVDDRKNYLPIGLESDASLRMGRFALPCNDRMLGQCQLSRADIRLTKIAKSLMGKG